MDDRLPISVLLLARDEAELLAELLPALAFAREIVMVWDPRGDPAVRSLAEARGARVFERVFDGFGPQRQFALAQARGAARRAAAAAAALRAAIPAPARHPRRRPRRRAVRPRGDPGVPQVRRALGPHETGAACGAPGVHAVKPVCFFGAWDPSYPRNRI